TYASGRFGGSATLQRIHLFRWWWAALPPTTSGKRDLCTASNYMKAVVWLGPRRMELQNEPEPQPPAGEVILRVDAVGICGSELSGYLGQNSLRVPPLVMGHEFAGTVAAA